MATILSGLLVEEVAKELLEEAPLPEILPVIVTAFDVSVVDSVVDVEEELSFLAHEIMVRLKKDISINCKIFFIFSFHL